MEDEARRLEVLIETNRFVLEELRRLGDPSLGNLISELERACADAEIQLAQLRAEQEREDAQEDANDTPAGNSPEDPALRN